MSADCADTGEFVKVRVSDLRHILDVYIDNGMVEKEDEDIVNRLWTQAQNRNGQS